MRVHKLYKKIRSNEIKPNQFDVVDKRADIGGYRDSVLS